MRTSTIICSLLAIVSVSRTVDATCAAQTVFDACIQRGKDMFNACGDQDYACKCQRQKDIRVCYENCKDDATITSQAQIQDGLVTTYCAQVPSSASSSVPVTSTGAMQSATSQGTTSPVATSATGSSVSRTSISPSITPNSGTQIATGGILVLVAANAFAFLAQQ